MDENPEAGRLAHINAAGNVEWHRPGCKCSQCQEVKAKPPFYQRCNMTLKRGPRAGRECQAAILREDVLRGETHCKRHRE